MQLAGTREIIRRQRHKRLTGKFKSFEVNMALWLHGRELRTSFDFA